MSEYDSDNSYSDGINMIDFLRIMMINRADTEQDLDWLQEIARSAFADMLHDSERNKLYYRALKLAIEKMHKDGKKANVLDIGTGSGLLSMMAVECGADTITACEAFEPVAHCCLDVLQFNKLDKKIRLIYKRSTDIIVGENGDMQEKANILVTEVFDTELIGEGALSTFIHAHKYLLEEDCIVVPDSAVIYAQVIECPFLQKWNKIEDVNVPELDLVLKSPQKMKDCAGTAAVHDLQLSQVPRSSFQELSDKIPVLCYDWSGKTPLEMNRTVKHNFTVAKDGKAQMVFMWWELNMDTEGEIVLSCAPWWNHPAAKVSDERPEDSIPWRDHWMQGVYYLPQELPVKGDTELTLVACQDEYSLWFYLEKEADTKTGYPRPVCECGVHLAWSRTHVSYLNDENQSKKLRTQLKREIKKDAVVLDLNGSSLLGLLAAKTAKTVYVFELSKLNLDILKGFVEANDISNVEFISELHEEVLGTVTNVISYPVMCSSILPWENLKIAHFLYKNKDHFKEDVSIMPKAFELWAMPVDFLDLHKIKVPVNECEGFNISEFGVMVKASRKLCDDEIEPQPLWEYPCTNSGQPRKILRIEFHDLQCLYSSNDTVTLSDKVETDTEYPVNGFALWAEWDTGDNDEARLSSSLLDKRERVKWDPHTRQGVKILEEAHKMKASDRWWYNAVMNLRNGHFHVDVGLRLASSDSGRII